MQQQSNTIFLGEDTSREIREKFGSPVYVYSEEKLIFQAHAALAFPRDKNQAFRVRFAMKACPNAAILQTFNRAGLNFDASSGYEVSRALRAGISPEKISLSSQEFPSNFQDLMATGIEFNACSLYQLEQFGSRFPGGMYTVVPLDLCHTAPM
jgi:diaminopimelate decarboxylase